MSGAAVRLVASREVRQRIRSRAYLLGTAVAALLAVAAILLPKLLSDINRPAQRVGVVGEAPEDFPLILGAAARAAGSTATVVPVADVATAEQQLRTGDLSLVLLDGGELVARVAPSLGESRGRLAQFLSIGLALQREPPVPIRGLEEPRPDRTARQFAAFIAIVGMFGFLVSYGTWTMSGVAEEKSSRVVEILLSTMPARALMLGKVTGIGILALTQGGVIAGAAALTAVVSGGTFVETGGLVVIGAALLWFLLGYALYSCIYAAAASTLGSAEEMTSISFPVQAPLMLSYFLCVTPVISGTPSTLLTVMSFIPLTAPVAMTGRIGISVVPWWQVVLSVGLTLVAVAVAVELAGRIYEASILRTGKRTKLREALSSTT